MNKVFGIGWAKTGTTTLGQCFNELGFKHKSQDLELVKHIKTGDLSKILEIADNYETFEDWPWIILYKELDEAFPGSRFVLTKRDPKKWVLSYKNMLSKQDEASEELNEIRQILYGLPFPNVTEEQLIQRYERHNREVEQYFSDRKNDLLIVNWAEDSGWEELCHFLGKDIPNIPFPHSNKGDYTNKGKSNTTFSKVYESVKNSFNW